MASRKFLFITLLALIFSCSKDPVLPLHVPSASDQSAIDRDPPPNCPLPNLPVLEIYFRNGGAPIDYTEQQIRGYLQCAGLNQIQVDDYVTRLFHANSTSPVLANEIVEIMLNCPAFVLPPPADADCFESVVIACGPFYPPAPPPCPNCPISMEDYCLSRIDLFGHFSSFVNEEGCAWYVFGNLPEQYHIFRVKKLDGTVLEFSFSNQVLIQTLINAGMSVAQANQALQNIAQGVTTARQFWELFQFRVAPYFSAIQSLPPEDLKDMVLIFIQFDVQYPYLPAGATSHTYYQIRGVGEIFCNNLFF